MVIKKVVKSREGERKKEKKERLQLNLRMTKERFEVLKTLQTHFGGTMTEAIFKAIDFTIDNIDSRKD